MNRIKRAKAFVKKHPHLTAFATGVAVGGAAVYLHISKKTLLELQPALQQKLIDHPGSGALYRTELGDVFLHALPTNK